MEFIFRLKNISYSYHSIFPALKNVSLDIEKGKCTVLLGANGSGKSTLLKIIDALIFPTKGKFIAFGKELTEKTMKDKKFNAFFRKNVGFIFQDPDAQLFLPTVRDELEFAPLQFHLKKDVITSIINKTAKNLGIEHLLDKFPFNLSEGEKKKVAIASIYTLNPEVWLMDEPTLALDPKTQWWIVEMIKELKRKKKTIIIATHNLKLAELIADRCVILSPEHKIVKTGTLDLLHEKHLLIKNNLMHEKGVL